MIKPAGIIMYMHPSVRKIDFFGGLHGNYLELVVNVFIDQLEFDLKRPLFNENGACHLKNDYPEYVPITKADHWSFNRIPFDDDDRVIRIVPKKQDMLIAVTNNFLRAGDQNIDIENLEKNTLFKMQKYPKLKNYMEQIKQDLGTKIDYSRAQIRNYFYSMFHDDKNGIDMYNYFDTSTKHYHEFPFRSFFNFTEFVIALNQIAKFVELEFQPSTDLWSLHSDFLSKNQGYHSNLKCQKIIDSIFSRTPMQLDLTIIEEAWINYQLSQIVDFYDQSFLDLDLYPKNTLEIAKKVFD